MLGLPIAEPAFERLATLEEPFWLAAPAQRPLWPGHFLRDGRTRPVRRTLPLS